MANEVMKNYDRSFKRMWEEIGRAREDRDAALKTHDDVHDLAISLRHDLGNGSLDK